MSNSPSARQLYALGFCVFTVPAILLLPRVGWLWAAITAAVTALVCGAVILLRRKAPCPVAKLAAKSSWGKAGLTLTLLWNLLMLGCFARLLCAAYPTGSAYPLVGLLLLLLAVYAGQKGPCVIASVGAIVFFFLLVFYALLFGFALPELRTQWLVPVTGATWQLLPAALAPLSVVYLSGGEKGKPLPWLLGGVALAVLAALMTAGSLSPRVAAAEIFPFYTAAKSVSILGAMERLEPLVSAALTAGGFCLLATLAAADKKIFTALLPESKASSALLQLLPALAGFWLSERFSATVLALGITIFWGIFPLGTLSLGARKKS